MHQALCFNICIWYFISNWRQMSLFLNWKKLMRFQVFLIIIIWNCNLNMVLYDCKIIDDTAHLQCTMILNKIDDVAELLSLRYQRHFCFYFLINNNNNCDLILVPRISFFLLKITIDDQTIWHTEKWKRKFIKIPHIKINHHAP